jgi:hypothetical protein
VNNRKERRAAASVGPIVQGSREYSRSVAAANVVQAKVARDGAGHASITIEQLQTARADKTFPADCAAARMRLDSPELHFAQLDPSNERRIVRLVVGRFERSRFVERAKQNEPFRLELETGLSKLSPERVSGRYSALLDAASFEHESVSALVDVEADLVCWTGGRAAVVLLVASQVEMNAAIRGVTSEIDFVPELEVTMTTLAVADLLLSWKNLAESLK